jgi:hypothetical protein
MRRVRTLKHRYLIAGTTLATLVVSACTLQSRDHNESASQAADSVRPTPTGGASYSVPTPRDMGRQETYVRFETGRAGAPKLTAPDDAVTCDINPHSGTRTYRATTSDFSQFDKGSVAPGRDFAVVLYVAGTSPPTGIPNQPDTDAPPFALFLEYVTDDGVHHTLDAADGVSVRGNNSDGSDNIGFSATATSTDPGPEREISVTGIISCNTVEEIP